MEVTISNALMEQDADMQCYPYWCLCDEQEDWLDFVSIGIMTRWGELIFPVYLILLAALDPGVYSASNRN
jgi:hypothetical protein